MIETLPLYLKIIIGSIIAPINEELVFRGVIRRFIKNEKMFIIISAIIFGLLHTLGEATLLNVIVLGIPYIIGGAGFAYMYAKTNNLFTSIMAHMILNTILTISFILTNIINLV